MTIKTEWGLSKLGKGLNDPVFVKERKEVEKAYKVFARKWSKDDSYKKNVTSLKKALDQYDELVERYSGGSSYAFYLHLSSHKDSGNKKIKAAKMLYFEEIKKLDDLVRFFQLELGKIEKKKQKEFLASPKLIKYKKFLSDVFVSSKYRLSDKEEKILAMKSAVASMNWVSMLKDFLNKEEASILIKNNKGRFVEKSVLFNSLLGFFDHKDKKTRESAFRGFNEILERNSDVAEREINSFLENKKIDDELRGFHRPDTARHLSDDIGEKTIDAMLEAVTEEFRVPKAYYKFKAQLFRKDKLRYYERNRPFGSSDKSYSFREAVGIVDQVFEELDPEFVGIFRKFYKNGQIDAFPAKGKTSGAFCSYYLKKLPTYLLLNFNKTLNNVLTLAHESGHGVHGELMKKEQPGVYCSTTFSTAEVASMFCESFVLEELLKDIEDKEKLSMLLMKLDRDISAVYRQLAAYKFELELHAAFRNEGYLPKERIGEIFGKNMKAYMGSGVEYSSGTENWWIYWGHFRRPFYVYSYASGQLIAQAMRKKLKEDKKFINKIKDFLSAGSSDSPERLFKKMGIDITKKEFWKEGLVEYSNDLKEAKRLAKKLGKI